MNSENNTSKLDIESEINEFVKKHNPKVCILTPCVV